MAIVCSDRGLMIRACGGASTEGQTVRIRLWLSKVSEPHSDGGPAPEVAASDAPSGPKRW